MRAIKIIWLLSLLTLSACSPTLSADSVPASPYDNPSYDKDNRFAEQVQPVLDKRCVVCHACYDAPCQLKLGSFEGIARGANKSPVYHGDRLLADDPSRLFIDALTPGEWREKDFFPVLDEVSVGNNQLNNSVLASMLALKKSHPTNTNLPLGDKFEFDINRDLQCPTIDEFGQYQKDHPEWGMPYGLPAISDSEHNTLIQWLQDGAPASKPVVISDADERGISQWEAFLNQESLKGQLVARYLYEHLFIAHIYFKDEQGDTRFYSLQRALTPPGYPFRPLATRRPFSSPYEDEKADSQRVYYRFMPVKNTVVSKLHMPILLDNKRMKKWRKWFFETDYAVTELPGYDPEVASNPFVTFAQLPVSSRYRFMIDEAQYTIMQFIKGPVCRGQIALNVINDHFWVMFLNPTSELIEQQDAFLRKARHHISLPAEAESNALPTNWIRYAKQEHDYLEARNDYIKNNALKAVNIDLNLIWQGDGNNDNAGLTIFRHNDAASVVKGLVGDKPQTAWILTYPLFERIHYLLVAGYDVYGNLGHQLNSRMYMDFLRMEGEFNFLTLLPQQERQKVWNYWYRGDVSSVEKYVAEGHQLLGETALTYTTNNPLNELYNRVETHLGSVLSRTHLLENGFTDTDSLKALTSLNQFSGMPASYLPQSSLVLVESENGEEVHVYTLLRNNAYTNISHILAEKERRLPEEDTLTVAYGFATSHPNAIFHFKQTQLPQFYEQVTALKNKQDLQTLFEQYGVRRTSPNFWQVSDDIHHWYKARYPLEFGYLDYNRLLDW